MTTVPHAPLRKRRILIVEDDTLVSLGLRAQLERLGHEVVAEASGRDDAVLSFRQNQPEVVLMDIRLDDTDGIEVATEILKIRRCPIVILSAFSDRELIDRAGAAGVFGYLIKPVSAESLQAQIEVAARRFEEHEQALTTLETRKLVEKAKGIFMRRLNLDEPEAHKKLQQESQKRRIGMAELAKKIIESEDILGGG